MNDTPKFCENCGAPQAPNIKFCEECGHPAEVLPVQVQEKFQPSAPKPYINNSKSKVEPPVKKGRSSRSLLVAAIVLILFLVAGTSIVLPMLTQTLTPSDPKTLTPVPTTISPTPTTTPKTTPIVNEIELFNNGNIYGVSNGPSNPTTFTLNNTYKITLITNYHWNDGKGSKPGTISLKDSTGFTHIWTATARPGQGGVPNAYWDVIPAIILGPGTYTVIDSDPSTWSQNSQSGNKGMTIVKGILTRSTST